MKALIDSDIFQYEFGNATDSEYKIIPWPFVQSRVQGRIDKIVEATQADSYQLYITNDKKDNFRYDIATILPYKGNRPSEKPYWYTHIRNFLVDQRGAIEVWGMEADDALAIEQYKNLWYSFDETGKKKLDDTLYESQETVICSKDKDLDMVPGWHYNWSRDDGIYFVTEVEGLRSFYCQLLTGDRVDNILGLFGVGKASKLLDRVRDCDTEYSMYAIVSEQYQKRFGNYSQQFLLENARLLWMKRTEDDVWMPPQKPPMM